MINNIEKRVSINDKGRLLGEKIVLSNKNDYIDSMIFSSLNNFIINQDTMKVIGGNYLIKYDKDYNLMVINLFNDMYRIIDIEGNILFEGKNLDILTDKLFVRNANKKDIFGKLLNYKVLCDAKGNSISKKSYDAIYNYSCDRIITIINKMYGVIDRYGNTIVKNKYKYISKFYNNTSIINDNNGYKLMDINGNIISSNYDTLEKSNDMYKVSINKKYGFIDRYGNTIIPCLYDYIGNYNESLILIEKDNKYGYINEKNEIIVNPIYDYASYLFGDIAIVSREVNGEEKIFIIDSNGNTIYEANDNIVNISKSDDDVLITTKVIDFNKDITKLGFIDKYGREIIPFIYDDVRCFKEGYAIVKLNNKYGVIDKLNNVIIDFKYDNISDCYGGYFITKGNDMKRGLIDINGKEILPCLFDKLVLLRNNKVYVDGYIYDINNLSLSYSVIINLSEDPFVIIKDFDNEKNMNRYYDLFNDSYNSFLDKVDLLKNKKLVRSK